ncbi:Hypothetical protein, conserved [Brucella abortus str. 2308 A]|uniref:Uncharacterized protein n=19 Tax=Brucella TaxID=234 RepID=Q2YS00_BRUA2|nr:hypothetical protein BMEI0306 [Brucella melitensis bv. 1 str. 16M]AAN30632.1 hypothetical protein BR1733 [Brucella suis 1330]AAX75037.1 hypothetical protein BruAb1_1718 [Brucella abortus bv. 1 str. 9-941]ABQ61843.1 hypothetical protein BOV_1675 [Brucella ovis ATCC 25840]ACU48702.1 hypothetical protein BMI_I1752 [Brucella microti CCM 4915]AEK55029.1 hypothetical protein BPI_I1793 [Brucella pinnipedialis B2/94]AEU06719.1 hypothetical protein BSVBI22_A1729 [Brucella suis VBI22]AHN47327.1 hyp
MRYCVSKDEGVFTMAFAIAPLIAVLKEYRRRQDERRRFIRTQRAIDGLPKDLRKDLDWPDNYLEQQKTKYCNGE